MVFILHDNGTIAIGITLEPAIPSMNWTSHGMDENTSFGNSSIDRNPVSEPNSLRWGVMAVTVLILCTTLGNLLVCLAVIWDKRLQNMTNYFLMSLAIADFLVSILVMPFGMLVEIFGKLEPPQIFKIIFLV